MLQRNLKASTISHRRANVESFSEIKETRSMTTMLLSIFSEASVARPEPVLAVLEIIKWQAVA
jgi:hypothetical protein